MVYVIGIQARTNSKRFPRKVLNDLLGVPLIAWVIESCKRSGLPVWLLTSDEKSDDELTETAISFGAEVFRGSLANVWGRYATFLESRTFDRIVRINGDSPLISHDLIRQAVQIDSNLGTYDLTSNVHPRSFPKGQSIEILNAKTFSQIPQDCLSESNQEHLTSFFYENSNKFKIRSILNDIDLSGLNLCVDFPSDLEKIKDFLLVHKIMEPNTLPDWATFSSLLIDETISL